MDIILRGGPCDGQIVTVLGRDRFHRTRVAGWRVLYEDTTEKDPATGLTIFAFRAEPAGVHQG